MHMDTTALLERLVIFKRRGILFLWDGKDLTAEQGQRVRSKAHSPKWVKNHTDVETGVQDMSFPPYIPFQANPHLRTQNTVSIPPSSNTTAFILPSHSFQHQAYSIHTEHSLHSSSTTNTHPTHGLPCLHTHSEWRMLYSLRYWLWLQGVWSSSSLHVLLGCTEFQTPLNCFFSFKNNLWRQGEMVIRHLFQIHRDEY